ncbi:MAG: hypothetical protein AABW89_00820 [Nanoarchaeota archaeon]
MIKRLEIKVSYDPLEEIKGELKKEGVWREDYVYRVIPQGNNPNLLIEQILLNGTDRTEKKKRKWDIMWDEAELEVNEKTKKRLRGPRRYTFAHSLPFGEDDLDVEIRDVKTQIFLMLIYDKSGFEPVNLGNMYVFRKEPLNALVALVQVEDTQSSNER